jgi:acyl-coenzyme A thioesterase PaaI-like protein
MADAAELTENILALLRKQHADHLDPENFPPPVFTAMQGEFLDYDPEQSILSVRYPVLESWLNPYGMMPEQSILSVRYPVLESWLNPYGMMQGGMVAAAIDNTIGPLSALIASANVTRYMDLKFSRAVTTEIGFIIVDAQLVERKNRWLSFTAEVTDPRGQRLAKAKAKHWIL